MRRCNVIVVGASASGGRSLMQLVGGVTFVLASTETAAAIRRLVALGAVAGVRDVPPAAR